VNPLFELYASANSRAKEHRSASSTDSSGGVAPEAFADNGRYLRSRAGIGSILILMGKKEMVGKRTKSC
jgi:hypothetical protein